MRYIFSGERWVPRISRDFFGGEDLYQGVGFDVTMTKELLIGKKVKRAF